MAPRVSVVIPLHNAAAFLERAVNSVRVQGISDMELLLIDDASTDGTAELARSLAGPDTRVLALDRNVGAAGARNAGLKQATGTCVAFLDADDEWLPGKLAAQLALMERDPRLGLVTCNSERVDPEGRRLRVGHERHPPERGDEAWRRLIRSNFIPTPTVLLRRAVLSETGLFDETLTTAEDYDLWLRIAASRPIDYVDEVFLRIHDRPASLMKSASGLHDDHWRVIDRHLEANAARLTPGEQRSIRGNAWFDQGSEHYLRHDDRGAMRCMWHAFRFGYRRGKALQMVLRAALRGILPKKR